MVATGYAVFDAVPTVTAWADAACQVVQGLDTSARRHGGTWFVGVDALPNAADGSIAGQPLCGPWALDWSAWHRAQISIVYPGYPGQDTNESDAAHRFRVQRDAAHLDGLLPEGPHRRRYLREPHAFILGIALTDAENSPLVVWPQSHHMIRDAMQRALSGQPATRWGGIDLTDAYHAARRAVFETCTRTEVPLRKGQSVLMHRHLIHGVAPWRRNLAQAARAVAYFRPQFQNVADWL